MILSAKFTGENSLGYETGKIYKLKMPSYNSMVIMRLDNTGRCPYQSIAAFLRNWTNIKVLNPNC